MRARFEILVQFAIDVVAVELGLDLHDAKAKKRVDPGHELPSL